MNYACVPYILWVSKRDMNSEVTTVSSDEDWANYKCTTFPRQPLKSMLLDVVLDVAAVDSISMLAREF